MQSHIPKIKSKNLLWLVTTNDVMTSHRLHNILTEDWLSLHH